MFSDWVADRFNLPEPVLFDVSAEADAEGAANALRQRWGLGQQPISNMVKLLEAKGVRVFSLAENNKHVDAFSCWRDAAPYVFLNTFKSAEHSRFDAAHELGHLVLHRHGGPNQGREAELEANRFAGCFLMPTEDIASRVRGVTALDDLVKAKTRWGVSVGAIAYRLHKMNRLTDWQYRAFCIEINRRGYRTQEPDGLAPERSVVWEKVLTSLWKSRITKDHIARELHLPTAELENLVFGLTGSSEPSGNSDGASLHLVTG
jgi:Zn-dependent peptidase ImmA (M78 family)